MLERAQNGSAQEKSRLFLKKKSTNVVSRKAKTKTRFDSRSNWKDDNTCIGSSTPVSNTIISPFLANAGMALDTTRAQRN